MNGKADQIGKKKKKASLPSSGHLIKMYVRDNQSMEKLIKLTENMTSKN